MSSAQQLSKGQVQRGVRWGCVSAEGVKGSPPRSSHKGYTKVPSPKRSASKTPGRRVASEPPQPTPVASGRKDSRRVRPRNDCPTP